YSLSISDINGITNLLDEWDFTADSEKYYQKAFDLSKYANGSYYIILKTPTNNYNIPLIIIK
ncbi:MAG TPA: hypothetical protein P5216_05265, partial [Bacteroidota bacterium]|nr:hypothetical protein [Bacteroidota bacterium]